VAQAQDRPVIPEARPLFTLAGDCGFPPVAVGRIVVRGEHAWARACFGYPIARPRERVVLFRGLEKPLLVSTQGGRARMRAWLDSRRASPEPAMSGEQWREHIAESVMCFGDETMVPDVERALARVPVYVADAALRNAMFLLGGRNLYGWYNPGRLPDRAVVVVARDAGAEETAVHECYHHWLGAFPNECHPMVPLRVSKRAMAVARAEGWPAVEVVEQRTTREERIVRALTTMRIER
jgi:hypothetical protein